jgi:hypothetical protein
LFRFCDGIEAHRSPKSGVNHAHDNREATDDLRPAVPFGNTPK